MTMIPGMGAAPMPEGDPMLGAMPPMPTKASEMVLMALDALKAERDGENAAVLAAVMGATGGMPSGLGGVSEGAPFAAPAAPPELGLPSMGAPMDSTVY